MKKFKASKLLLGNRTIAGNAKKVFLGGTLKTTIDTIREYRPLDKYEEIKLVIQYQKGDEKSGQKVILHNQSIVYQIAKDYGKNEEEISDFIMEGNLGLYEAMKRFDYSKDNKFYTYARWWIMAYMSYYASSDYTLVRVPSYGGALRRARKIENDYFLEHGRYPTIEEVKDIITTDISEKTGNQKYKVPYVEGIYDMDYISLGLTYGEECDTTFEESDEFVNRTKSYNQYEELSEEEYNKTTLLPLLNLLDPDEKTIIMKLYQIGKYKGYTKYQVCQEYNLKESDIDRISKRLLKRMKDGAKNIKY